MAKVHKKNHIPIILYIFFVTKQSYLPQYKEYIFYRILVMNKEKLKYFLCLQRYNKK